MDSEYFEVSADAAERITKSIKAGKRVIVVGTSTVRALESSVTADGFVRPNKGWTDKFIFPPYQFRITKRLVTNFHMPESTLLMLVSAFAGTDVIMKAYRKAMKSGFHFLSFGDAMLII
jgi:S-adenosylmethionine:tRNA ribosyltransferase-isomerase